MSAELRRLVERFHERRDEYQNPGYSEAQVRIDFLNPLFSLLGWDVANVAGLAFGDREVVTEPRQRVEDGGIEFPDYLFRTGGRPVFAVEAKKPAVNLKDNPLPALQLRRYAWNSKILGVGILTDFQEFCVYDCRLPPAGTDRANKARVDYYTYDQYVDVWDDIESRFSRSAGLDGALDEYVAGLAGARGKQRVDRVFLSELDAWRRELAVALAKNNKLEAHGLNTAVQRIIDRIVFLRISEDRGLERYGELRELIQGPGVYARIVERFRRADEKYNSGLFHFTKEKGRTGHDTLTPLLTVPDAVLRGFISRLYWPEGPYDFATFPPDVLGHVYEQFLGKVITLRTPKQADVEDKPEVRKAGGVFYTPTHVVRHITAATLAEGLKGRTPETIARTGLTVCDPSCGSGSFLIEVYQQLLDWHLEHYLADATRWSRTRPARLQRDINGNWRLTTGERKRILLAHIFGVDIDAQAVEVTKLALLLKVLEGETGANLHAQTELFHDRVLPDLVRNIKCGNSLVGNAFHFQHDQLILSAETENKVNAFDWPNEFDDIARGRGFDIVVGNPPWLMAGYHVAQTVPYLQEKFQTATGKFDLYYVFLEQALRILTPGGRLGMIVPNKFFHTGAGKALRQLLAQKCRLVSVQDFGLEKVFEGATNYSCILIATNDKPAPQLEYRQVTQSLEVVDRFAVKADRLDAKTWSFQNDQARAVFDNMRAAGTSLEQVTSRFGTGVQSGADTLLTFTPQRYEELGLEPDLGRPLARGRDVRAFRLQPEMKTLLFPYADAGAAYRLLTEKEMKAYPVAWAHLKQHRDRLASRVWFGKSAEELSGAWYGLMYVEARSTVTAPHLLTPSLSGTGNFAAGDGTLWATGTAGVTAVVPAESCPLSMHALTAVLNSRCVSAYVAAHSPIYQGGFHKYSAPYLKEIPLPQLPKGAKRRQIDRDLAALTKQIEQQHAAHGDQLEGPTEGQHRKLAGLGLGIDEIVYGLYGLTDQERAWVMQRTSRLRGS